MKKGTKEKKEFINNGMDAYFSPVDLHLGRFLSSLSDSKNASIRLAVLLTSRSLRDGHVCLNLRSYAGNLLTESDAMPGAIRCPELTLWRKDLQDDRIVGIPGEFKPLILDAQDRLYFHRYWQYEKDVADFILQRLSFDSLTEKKHDIRQVLLKYFPEAAMEDIYQPAMAAVSALIRKYLVITGSPGTGKTTTVTKILAFLNDVSGKPLKIALAAPTGKAAARLEEALGKTIAGADWPQWIVNAIPSKATTIHRLLGSIRFSPYFRHHEKNHLPYDVIVIDESSMVALPLMAKIMKAIAPEARLILLGDKDQLASVEAGAVLGSICGVEDLNLYSEEFEREISELYGKTPVVRHLDRGVRDCIVELNRNYRFSRESALGQISEALKKGNLTERLQTINAGVGSEVTFHELDRSSLVVAEMIERMLTHYAEYLEALSMQDDVEQIFLCFEKFRILCALKTGFWGVQRINELLERGLMTRGRIARDEMFYEGRPVMITQNDYQLGLFNGDTGITLREKKSGKIRIFFKDENQGIKIFFPEQLPHHETAWAMTIHKSQGSEFDRVALILSDTDNALMTRELVYTGITRARQFAEIWSKTDIFKKSVQRQIKRESGLIDALR